ncbi:MAG: hypothetical protein GY801_25555 [bacterium]|nr:hypothetical protein [bacterium]
MRHQFAAQEILIGLQAPLQDKEIRQAGRPQRACHFVILFQRDDFIRFLNAILRRTGTRRIVEVAIANPYNEREFQQGKLSIVDVKAIDKAGHQYQIEVQRAIHAGLAERIRWRFTCCNYRSGAHRKSGPTRGTAGSIFSKTASSSIRRIRRSCCGQRR